jgi:hypothetical protein
MSQVIIFYPMLAQVLLTGIVFFFMYHARVNEVRSKSIHPQNLATNADMPQCLPDSVNVSENFSNQFEMPVLFYVLCICLYVTEMVTVISLITASAFVFFRAIHSLIHCTNNKVMHRFYAYAVSSLLLWAMWAVFAYRLITNAE